MSVARDLVRPMQAVVLGALIHDGRVLLVHRRADKHANPDVWDLPGGLVEHGESDEVALARELQEELGIRIEIGSTTPLCQRIASPAGAPVLFTARLLSEWHGTPANAAPEEHDALGWFSLDELPPPPHIIVRTALVEAMSGHHA